MSKFIIDSGRLVYGSGAMARSRNIKAIKEMLIEGCPEPQIYLEFGLYFKDGTIGGYIAQARRMIASDNNKLKEPSLEEKMKGLPLEEIIRLKTEQIKQQEQTEQQERIKDKDIEAEKT